MELDANDTFTLSRLIDNLKSVIPFSDWPNVEKGLKILKVFRNKEGHVAAIWHKYHAKNYRDIEGAVKLFYSEVFDEEIDFQIFMEAEDKGIFSIKEK